MMKTTPEAGRSGVSRLFRYEILLQIEVVVGLSALLGLTFNAANPIGVRFSTPTEATTSPPAQAPPSTAPDVNTGSTFKPQAPNRVGGVSRIAWREVKPLLAAKKIVLVDARPKVNYDQGHIPGAVSLPYSANPKASSTPEDFAAFQSKYPKDTPIVVYCTSVTCQLSQVIAEKLFDELGYTNVRKMNEGYLEYSEAEIPSSSSRAAAHTVAPEATTASPVSEASKPGNRTGNIPHVGWAEVKPLLEAKKIVLVDARPKVNYDEGHIPGAVSLPYSANPKFSSAPEDFAAFQKSYPKDTPIVVYCTSVTCQLSQVIAEKLADEFGYTQVHKMNEGYLEYTESLTASEKPAAQNPAHPKSAQAPPQTTSPSPTPAPPSGRNPSRTSWAVVKPLLQSGQIVLVDVRQAPTYELGHVPGAVNLSYTSTEDAFAEFVKEYPKNAHLVLYCTDVGCPLSMKMAEILVNNYGYQHVQHMTEGYAELQRDELVAKQTAQ